jgi:hypothetical protein
MTAPSVPDPPALPLSVFPEDLDRLLMQPAHGILLCLVHQYWFSGCPKISFDRPSLMKLCRYSDDENYERDIWDDVGPFCIAVFRSLAPKVRRAYLKEIRQ